MFKNFKISTRLFLGFGLMVVFIIGVGEFAILQMHTLSQLTTNLYDHPLTVNHALHDIKVNLFEMRSRVKDTVLARNSAEIDAATQMVDSLEKDTHEQIVIVKQQYLGDKADGDELEQLFIGWKPVRDEIIASSRAGTKEQATEWIIKGKGFGHFSKLQAVLKKMMDFATNKAEFFMKSANAQARHSTSWMVGLLLIVSLLAIWIAFTITRAITCPLNLAVKVANGIAEGNLDNPISVLSTNEIGQVFAALARMQARLRERITEDKRIAVEALRINRALDNATTAVLITDNQYEVIYLNEAAKHLFKDEEGKIRTVLPKFRAELLLGHNVDFFHKNPASQRELLGQLTNSRRAKVTIGGIVLDHIITPVVNDAGERLGMVIEFTNRTVEVATEQEINAVTHAASQGDFTPRIDLNNKSGFFKAAGESINQTLDFMQRMIEEIMRVFAAMSRGDLTQTIENNYRGALEQLKNDVNGTVKKLTEILTVIKKTADAVNVAAEEITQGNLALSQRTEQQAASLEQTAASMEQMTSTVQQNADNARQATQLAISARDRATQGGEVVGAAVAAMSEINNSSKKVNDIIGVIDGIAFQTNLLALNAAVEAARAGEQGRGFAVVAAEVRNLAQRSAEAAKEIKGLIRDSVTKVEEGTRLVNQSGKTLADIVTSVKKVSDIISEIAAAGQEQSSGIHQVNKAITQMDEMTQQNASLVEQAAAASEAMRGQVQNLNRQVAFFKMGEEPQLQSGIEKTSTEEKKSGISRPVVTSRKRALTSPTRVTPPKQVASTTLPAAQKDDGWEDF
jgi:methyl-accepting chemotaxis protein